MYLEDTDYECPYCQGQIFDSTEGRRTCIHCQRVFDIDNAEAKKEKKNKTKENKKNVK